MTPTPLEVYLLTFNCARSLVDPSLLGPHIFDAWPQQEQQRLPDVVAFSLQEVAPIAYSFLGQSWIESYLERIEESLHIAAHSKVDGADHEYIKIASHSIGMTAALIFVRKGLEQKVKDIRLAGTGVGVWEMGNKGGVGVRVSIDNMDLTFVAMHLAPMESSILRRNQDWEDICRGLVFEDAGKPQSQERGTERQPLLAKDGGSARQATEEGLYQRNNNIFLFGDLNYRTSDEPPTSSSHKIYPQPNQNSNSNNKRISLEELLSRDQLTQERLADRVLHGFDEAPIAFPPTYKYSHDISGVPGPQISASNSVDGSETSQIQEPSTWTWAKHRWPSWCDRILFYPPDGVKAGTYTALPLLPSSDHRPVALHVTVLPATGSEDLPKDLRKEPPFAIDPHWRTRRAAARRYEIVVGSASWLVLTTAGQSTLGGLLGTALAAYLLMHVFGHNM